MLCHVLCATGNIFLGASLHAVEEVDALVTVLYCIASHQWGHTETTHTEQHWSEPQAELSQARTWTADRTLHIRLSAVCVDCQRRWMVHEHGGLVASCSSCGRCSIAHPTVSGSHSMEDAGQVETSDSDSGRPSRSGTTERCETSRHRWSG